MTVPTFLSALPIDADEAEKLRNLGVDSPQHLLAMINAAPDAFARFFGVEATGRLGVPPGAPPQEPRSTLDIARRDALFDRLQQLKANRASPREIEDAERALDAFFAASR